LAVQVCVLCGKKYFSAKNAKGFKFIEQKKQRSKKNAAL
jgi:hypothetical protein